MRQRTSRTSRAPRQPNVGAVDAGLKLLAFRAHSRAELRRKLDRRGYGEEEVEAAVERLVELGYLDDRSFAEGHVRRRSGALGPLALSRELAARGVDREVADGALEGFDQAAQMAVVTRLVERLVGQRSFAGYREMLDSVGSKLVRRGFSPGVVRAACRAVWNGTLDETEA